jgi:hypothetical protein
VLGRAALGPGLTAESRNDGAALAELFGAAVGAGARRLRRRLFYR